MGIEWRGCALGAALVLSAALNVFARQPAPQQPATAQPPVPQQPASEYGVVANSTPMYLFPDASRTPLATLPPGAAVRVISRERDWYRVEYRDNYLGVRTGYIQVAAVRIQPGPAPSGAGGRGPIPGALPPSTLRTAPPPVAASPPGERGFVSLNGSYQQQSTAFRADTTFTQNVEPGRITTNYGGGHPIVADLAVGYRVWRMIDIAVALTYATRNSDAAITAALPHPFSFNTFRTVSGVASSVKRQETAVHFDAAVVFPQTGRVQVAVFGGPSLFRVRQGLVTAVSATEVYPYDTATFASATTIDTSRMRVGYNGGADLSVKVWKNFGVGAIARYSRADVHFTPADGVDVQVKAGGLQAGAGIRFRF